MQKPSHHIFVCGSFRVAGETRGSCFRKESIALLQYFESEISDRDMDGVLVSSTGCLNLCDHAPVVVVYPDGNWYGGVNEEKAEEILDGLESGKAASGLIA